jgi:hypothetical protein
MVMEFKIYIDTQPVYNRVDIHAIVLRENGKEVLSYKDGAVISTIVEEGQHSPPFLTLPLELFKTIEEQIIMDMERRGGAPSQQYMRGKVDVLEKFVEWFKTKV